MPPHPVEKVRMRYGDMLGGKGRPAGIIPGVVRKDVSQYVITSYSIHYTKLYDVPRRHGISILREGDGGRPHLPGGEGRRIRGAFPFFRPENHPSVPDKEGERTGIHPVECKNRIRNNFV